MRYLRRYRPPTPLPQCTCPEGLLRFEPPQRVPVGWWCAACRLVTLRDEAEVERFLDLYEDDALMRSAVIRSLYLEDRRREVNAGLEAPRPAKDMETLPFD